MDSTSPAVRDTRGKLLDAALTVIRTKGYTATTVDDICVAAGVTKGSFFHYFKSKEDLALASAGPIQCHRPDLRPPGKNRLPPSGAMRSS